jgi:hypothetical protein
LGPFSCYVVPYSFSVVPRAMGTFSYFTRPNSFSTAPGTSSPVFMFCAPGIIFSVTEGVGSSFPVLRSRTRFWRYRGRRVPFSCFSRSDSFTAVTRASGPVFIFCAPGQVFGCSDDVVSRFHILRSRSRFGRYRGRQSHFHVLPTGTCFRRCRGRRGPIFMFYAPGLIFSGAEVVGCRFHVLRAHPRFRRN